MYIVNDYIFYFDKQTHNYIMEFIIKLCISKFNFDCYFENDLYCTNILKCYELMLINVSKFALGEIFSIWKLLKQIIKVYKNTSVLKINTKINVTKYITIIYFNPWQYFCEKNPIITVSRFSVVIKWDQSSLDLSVSDLFSYKY